MAEKYSYHILFIHLLTGGHLSCSLFLDIMNNTAVNVDMHVFVRACVFISRGIYLGVELPGPVVTLCLTF